ncbi:MAG TPA: metal ABC transporter permease [Saprospiraceae bacterium]|nr:metal ABC transporter permease [Saprospiraceae bacterium]
MFKMFQLEFILLAFVISFIIGVLLSYLGVHVVKRGIVFVDLALGQISSLGVAFSDYVGYGHTVIPIAFALVGALLMSFIHLQDKRLKVEAIIGIIYAVTSAATVMLISKSPHGDSDIQEVLFGNILSVDWSQIKLLGLIFLGIALLHFIFRKKFFALTESFVSNESSRNGTTFKLTRDLKFWNFLFYITIGLTIVFAIRTSGVIPVFSFLIIPAVCGIMLARKNVVIVISAIAVSVIGAFFGLNVSYHFDFPAGSSLVAVLGVLFILVSIIYMSRGKKIENN